MVLFDANGKIWKYENVNQIIKEFYEVWLERYHKWKDYMLKLLNKQHLIALNKHNFVKGFLENTLKISGLKK